MFCHAFVQSTYVYKVFPVENDGNFINIILGILNKKNKYRKKQKMETMLLLK